MDKGNPQAYQSHVEFMQKQHNQIQQAQQVKQALSSAGSSNVSNHAYPNHQGSMKYVQPNSAYPNLSASYGGSSSGSGAMSLKEQQKRDEMRNHGHLVNNMNMLNSGQGPDNGTFYNYL